MGLRLMRFVSTAVACIGFTAFSFAASAPALRVLSATPRGVGAASGRQAITVSFNQPVVALSQDSQFAAQDCPLQIYPKVSGTCRYAGTQALLFEPTEDWPKATRFTVQIPASFTSGVSGKKLGKLYRFTFSTQVPQVERVIPSDETHWLTLTPTLYAAFNLPVDPARAAKAISLTAPNGKTVPLTVRALTNEEQQKEFSFRPINQLLAISPAQKLRPATRYTLTFAKGLPSAVGTVGMQQPYQTHFYTYPPLAVSGVKAQGCLPFNLGVRFTTPVRLRELAAAMTVSPADTMRPLTEQEKEIIGQEVVLRGDEKRTPEQVSRLQERYNLSAQEIKTGTAFFYTPLSFINVLPQQPITVTLSKDLQDIYGNTLGQDYTFIIENNGYCPAVDLSGGFGVLESTFKPRLPVDLMNITALPVQMARFNKNTFIPFAVADEKTPWCAPRELAHPTYNSNYHFTKVQDNTFHTYIDLAQAKPTAQDSIIFSQVQRAGADGELCWVKSTTNITDVGLTLKSSALDTLVWATSLEKGTPLANVSVELRDETNRVLYQGKTDEKGLLRAPGWEKLGAKQPQWGRPVIYAFAGSNGGDGVLSSQLNDGLEPWRFNITYEYAPKATPLHTELFTERGVYRPGEKIYLKGILRQLVNGAWQLPQGISGKLQLSDSSGAVVETREVKTTASGALEAIFDVPAKARTGNWEIAFIPDAKWEDMGAERTLPVRVETIKAADFEVSLRADKPVYFPGQEAKFSAAAIYNFGAPLADAKASWTLRRADTWFEPKGFDEYVFVPYFLQQDNAQQDSLLVSDHGATDAQGVLSFTATMPEVQVPTSVYGEVGVQSPAKQDLFARTSVLLHPASFYLGTRFTTSFAQANKPVQARIVAVNIDGKPVSAQATVTLVKEQWFSVRKVGLSGRLEWVNTKQTVEVSSQPLSVGEQGADFTFTPDEGGRYYIKLTATDEQGRTVRGGNVIYVSGEGELYGPKTDDDLLVISADKKAYTPGQKARIQIESPYAQALALVTVEREGILDAWTVPVKGPSAVITVPVKQNYLPNAYVSVLLVRGRTAQPVDKKGLDLGKPQIKIGYTHLTVEPKSKRMDVALKTNATAYRPGETVRVDITTKANGKAAPAEVTLMVVDEGVLALTHYQTPDLFKAFYGPRPMAVFTADNRAYVIGQRNFGEKGENRGGGGGELSKLGGTDLRSHFSFVPYYQATVQTNAKGKATVSFTLPDNLTKFRIMAVAARESEFGSAATAIQVSKPLMITSNLPRFARVDDAFSCGAVVYNYEDKKGEFTVSAQAQGAVELTGNPDQTVVVPLGTAKQVSWPCRAVKTGPAQVAFTVRGRKSSDGVLAKLTVATVEKQQTLSRYHATRYQENEVLQKPQNLDRYANNRITGAISSTALVSLKGAMVYLMTYPHDCLEQQLSKIVPVVVGEKMIHDFDLGNTREFKQQAQRVLDQLGDYQTQSGGFSYWKNDAADPYVTAYALDVAYVAKQAGYRVPTEVLNKAAEWLSGAFNSTTKTAYVYSVYENETARAYAVYVLGLYNKPMKAAFNNLYAQRLTLPVPALAYLLKAAALMPNSATVQTELAQQLINQRNLTSSGLFFFAPNMPWLHSSDVHTTALVVESMLSAHFAFDGVYSAVNWMLGQLDAQGHWASTSDNAAVLRALYTYYTRYEKESPQFTADVSVNQLPLVYGPFQGHTQQVRLGEMPFDRAYGEGATARVLVAKQGPGMLYYTLSQEYTPASYDTPVQAGFEISRALYTLDGKPAERIQAGQRYRVTLTVRNAMTQHFVVLEDFVPAGFEILNTALATESEEQAATVAAANAQSANGFIYDEKYTDRIAVFADYLPAGTHHYSFLVSAFAAGSYAYPSAWVSNMYEPSVFGRTETEHLTVQ